MLLREELLERGIVAGLCAGDERLQPHGIDLRVRALWQLRGPGRLGADGSRELPQREAVHWSDDGWAYLRPGSYGLVYEEVVQLPSDCAGLVFPRSTLLRMGAHLPTAVWDAGYSGRGETLLEVWNHAGLWLQHLARVAQFVVFSLSGESAGYTGRYLGENR